MQLSFAVIPLVVFTNDKRKMGEFANRMGLKIAVWGIAAIVLSLNVYLLLDMCFGFSGTAH
jgi:manganese transport protein